MRFDKFTLKAQEVIQTSQQLAERFNHQQIEPEHLVTANIAHDLLEAEAMLTRLAQRGYIEDWRTGRS